MAEWGGWTCNPAIPGLKFRSGHLLDLFLVLPSSNLRPPTSCYVLFGLFVPNYLSEYP